MKNTSLRRSLARNLHTLAFWIDPKAMKHYKAIPKQPEFYGKGITEIQAEQQAILDGNIKRIDEHLKMSANPMTIKSINPPENVENQGNPVPASVEPTDGKENGVGVAVVQAEQQATV